ncbi:restriction endonuclease [Pseudoclavibacter sp. AY1F1]|uniref:restriction endonuclease subunit S n=1 Tax=Pseudoclavibacter sp. AY1F1 TaxID=2080583 RepID=UPI000CE7B9CB|nr:restriction endonuclease subunit S [Pseudoclavibacter sp. AY1F1]PPF44842.1 restriction endonuclease [Pseudoclavibacter sp. AY1F1]
MSKWRDSTLGGEIELLYGKALPAHVRAPGDFVVYGSNGPVGVHDVGLIDGPGIIVGRKGSVGEVVYSSERFWPIDTTYYVKNRSGLDWRYLYHLLGASGLTKLNSHSAVPGLNRADAYSIPVRVPPPSTQVDIARVLDCLSSAVELETRTLRAAEDLVNATISVSFGVGLNGGAMQETSIGPIPVGWELRTISELCEIWSGGTPRKSVPEFWVGEIPWVSGKDLKRPVIADAIDHISEAAVDAGSRLAPEGAVLLLVRGMGLAKDLPVATVARPMAFNQDVKALVLKGAYSSYPGRLLRSAIYAGRARMLSQIVPSAHGTMTLNLNDVETFEVAWPTDIHEAMAVVAAADAGEHKVAVHRRRVAVLEQLLAALADGLLSEAIDVRDVDLSMLSHVDQGLEEALV